MVVILGCIGVVPIVSVSLHITFVLEFGLQEGVLHHADPHIHAHYFLFHPRQTFANIHQRGSVRHTAPSFLHLGLYGLQIIGYIRQLPGSIRHTYQNASNNINKIFR